MMRVRVIELRNRDKLAFSFVLLYFSLNIFVPYHSIGIFFFFFFFSFWSQNAKGSTYIFEK